jgi:hypothetical protein
MNNYQKVLFAIVAAVAVAGVVHFVKADPTQVGGGTDFGPSPYNCGPGTTSDPLPYASDGSILKCVPWPSISSGTQTSLSPGATPTLSISGTNYAPVLNFGIPAGAIGAPGSVGSQGIKGDTGATGAAGTNAVNFGARVQTDATGVYTWTFPAGCQHSSNIPYFNAVAEGPTPQGGVTVNPQVEGVPTATTVSFRVTKVTATTVALLGLTILSVPGNSATFLDLTCAPQ